MELCLLYSNLVSQIIEHGSKKPTNNDKKEYEAHRSTLANQTHAMIVY